MNKKYLILASLALIFSIAVGATAFVFIRPFLHKNISFNSFNKLTQQEDEAIETMAPYPNWNKRERQRALAVVIDNTENARPQSGLELAEVVIEVPVEGGQTRLLAIISGEDQELLGPVRSARGYFVDLAKEYKAILVHAGGPPDALEAIKKESIDNLDEIYSGTHVAAAFWRVMERPKPYNLYSSSDSLRRAAVNTKYNLTTPPYERATLKTDEEVTGDEVSDITIFYPNRLSLVHYQYNKGKLVFERYMEEKPHMNAKGEQLSTANVIVQYVPFQFMDGDGRLRLIMHGKGNALVFREGKLIEGLWEKTPGQFTKFIDKKGNTIPLVEGPTWIEVVPNGTRVEY